EFTPYYVVPNDKKKQVAHLKTAVKDASELLLATDPDREGEAISWHLTQVLKPKIPVHRIVFHEITEDAVKEALEHPGSVNEDLVRAQESRRILDRLYGYTLSPLLWKKVQTGLSAGRVQSVAVRLIVEREEERRAFRTAVYWDLEAKLRGEGREFVATLARINDQRIATGKDFDAKTGELKNQNVRLLDEAVGQSDWRIGARHPRDVRRGVLRWTAALSDAREERAGSARSDSSHRFPSRAESARTHPRFRRPEDLRAGLEADDGVADG